MIGYLVNVFGEERSVWTATSRVEAQAAVEAALAAAGIEEVCWSPSGDGMLRQWAARSATGACVALVSMISLR